MMKNKLVSLGMTLVLAAGCLLMPACSKNNESDDDTAGKTTIKVGTYDGGVGMDWLNAAAKRFEEKYKDVSFEEGKTGVSIKVTDSKGGDMLLNSSLDRDVYFTESIDYYTMVQAGKLADISDVVTGDLSTYGESGTIAAKLDSAMSDFLTAKGGKYYAVPFYDGFHGFIYDADMFASQGWYFDESGNFTKTNKSKGMDGIAGTSDDGLPKTYAQFATLMKKIVADGVTPITYSTESMTYFISLLASYWADYEGKEKMQINWSFSGTTDIVSSFDSNGNPVIETLSITDENINELQKQPGKYYALKFLKEVVFGDTKNYASASDFKAAQMQLIQSCLDGDMQDNPAALLVDGCWWENEAELAGTFELVSSYDPSYSEGSDYKKQRNFAFMPIPMADDTETTLNAGGKNENGTHKRTLVSANDSFCFVNAGTTGAKLSVAKEFVKFVHTDSELAAFTVTTSMTRPFSYTVSEAQKSEMSPFGKSVVDLKENSDIVYPYSNNATYVAKSASYLLGQWAWKSNVKGKEALNPFSFFRDNASVTAKEYFEGLYTAQNAI